VIFNLIGNAVKFTSSGQIRVTARCDAGGKQFAEMRVSVTDSGIGIAPDKIGSLFQRCSPAHISTERAYGGTGMGLAISKKLIDLMGGSLYVQSQAGTGSTFGFTLRLALDTNGASASFNAPE
jgi:signal transduction histidine kinase